MANPKGRVRGRGQVVSGYLLYRGDWISSKIVARDLRAIADMIEGDKDTEWFILPVNGKGHECNSDDDLQENYIITPSMP